MYNCACALINATMSEALTLLPSRVRIHKTIKIGSCYAIEYVRQSEKRPLNFRVKVGGNGLMLSSISSSQNELTKLQMFRLT